MTEGRLAPDGLDYYRFPWRCHRTMSEVIEMQKLEQRERLLDDAYTMKLRCLREKAEYPLSAPNGRAARPSEPSSDRWT